MHDNPSLVSQLPLGLNSKLYSVYTVQHKSRTYKMVAPAVPEYASSILLDPSSLELTIYFQVDRRGSLRINRCTNRGIGSFKRVGSAGPGAIDQTSSQKSWQASMLSADSPI